MWGQSRIHMCNLMHHSLSHNIWALCSWKHLRALQSISGQFAIYTWRLQGKLCTFLNIHHSEKYQRSGSRTVARSEMCASHEVSHSLWINTLYIKTPQMFSLINLTGTNQRRAKLQGPQVSVEEGTLNPGADLVPLLLLLLEELLEFVGGETHLGVSAVVGGALATQPRVLQTLGCGGSAPEGQAQHACLQASVDTKSHTITPALAWRLCHMSQICCKVPLISQHMEIHVWDPILCVAHWTTVCVHVIVASLYSNHQITCMFWELFQFKFKFEENMKITSFCHKMSQTSHSHLHPFLHLMTHTSSQWKPN